jgi:hypothetical protein
MHQFNDKRRRPKTFRLTFAVAILLLFLSPAVIHGDWLYVAPILVLLIMFTIALLSRSRRVPDDGRYGGSAGSLSRMREYGPPLDEDGHIARD